METCWKLQGKENVCAAMNEWFCCLHMYVSRTTESRQKNELNEGMWYLLEALYNTFPNVCFSSWGCINSAMGTAGNGSQEGKINTVEPPQTDTSLQRPYFLVPADSLYIASCLNLTTTVKATKARPQPAKLPLDLTPRETMFFYLKLKLHM